MSDDLTAALMQAAKQFGLQPYYVDLVRPILRQPREQWPTCCGGGCEPCAQTLVAVADRVQQLLGTGE